MGRTLRGVRVHAATRNLVAFAVRAGVVGVLALASGSGGLRSRSLARDHVVRQLAAFALRALQQRVPRIGLNVQLTNLSSHDRWDE